MSNVYRDPEDPDKIRRIVETAVESGTSKAFAKVKQQYDANEDTMVNIFRSILRPIAIVLVFWIVVAGLDNLVHPEVETPPSQEVANLATIAESIGHPTLSCRVLCEPYAVKTGPTYGNSSDDCVCSTNRVHDESLIIQQTMLRSVAEVEAPAATAEQPVEVAEVPTTPVTVLSE